MKQELSRKAKVGLMLLENPQGVSDFEMAGKLFMSHPKNEVYRMEKQHGLLINHEKRKNERTHWIAFRIPNKAEAYRLIKLINHERKKCGFEWITQAETNHYLSQFEGEL